MARRPRIAFALAAACAWLALACGPARAEWQPPGLQPASATLAGVLAANAKATGSVAPGFAERRERWTYANGALRLPVEVAVKGDDFRADVALGAARYAAGRAHGVRWRADANGVAHATLSDLQGDALDRLPQSPFGWSAADCALAGETRGAHPAWVIADRAPRDKPHWFFVDQASGLIVRELTREGARTVVTTFDRFEPLGGALRARHWHVAGGRGNDLDVTLDAVEPAAVPQAALALPAPRRVFAPLAPSAAVLPLPARFDGRRIVVEVDLGARRRVPFILDTGTASITLDSGLAARLGLHPALEHATVPRMTVGGLAGSDVSTLAIPLGGLGAEGILGYDFFFGHVVHVDYAHQRVEVLPHESADAVFRDASTTALAANVAEGLPLARVTLGTASSERFALDTGSDRLVVLEPFRRRHASEVAHWTPAVAARANATGTLHFLEGSLRVAAWSAPELEFGPSRFGEPVVALQALGNDRPDALDLPFDGIVGTDVLAFFDCWFDYDNGRIGLRR
ncbi:MAG: hypothetical protein QOI11_2786 [Candidatus Eremiobacteraeota bacterium]|jgi:hypothetical protein|nr:hypothetical protein [Candidatus Eremiobacteraeota bacterium]